MEVDPADDARFEAVMAKLRKLLAKAERTDVEAEAEAFLAKAQQLMARWQIDEAMLAAAEGRVPTTVVTTSIPMPSPHAARRAGLAYRVALANDCEAVQVGGGTSVSAVVVGHANDVEWVQTLFASLSQQLDAALARARRSRPPGESPKAFATAFVAGFVQVVGGRVAEAAEAARRQAEAEAGSRPGPGAPEPGRPGPTHPGAPPAGGLSSVALVLAAKQDGVRSEFRAQFPHLRSVRRSGGTSAAGHRAGRDAGARASIARGAASAGTRAPLPR